MSDLSIVEITDTSIKISKPDLVLGENNKRKLSNENNDDDELEDSMAEKKICRDPENFVSINKYMILVIILNICDILRMIQA